MNASDLFSAADRERIARAIADAEARTSGEIVPVVAAASGRYDRAEDLFGVLVALAAVTTLWLAGVASPPPDESWGGGGQTARLALVLITVAAGFIAGSALAARFPALRLPFIPSGEMRAEVERSAEAAFHRFRLRETAGATGILIYVSLYERRVRVLGDAAIGAKLGAADWRHLCDAVTETLAGGEAAEALVRGIALAGELLARHFPRESRDRNELVNELIVIG